MKKPIFRIFATYSIKKKASSTREKVGVIDTFVLTDNINEIKQDKELIDRICYINKRSPFDSFVEIKSIDIENQYGETTDRFND